MSRITSDIDPTSDALLDERNITRALSNFARLADAKDYLTLGEVFAEDVVFDYGSGREAQGLSALTDLLTLHLDRCGPTQHLIGTVVVVDDVAGDRAFSRAYVQARHQRRDDLHGSVFDTNGEYADQWEKRSDGWRIVDRRAHWSITTGDSSILAVAR